MSVRRPVQPSRADDRSLGQLLSAATQDVSHLVRQEIQLAKVETRGSCGLRRRAGAMFGAAGVAALLALFLLAFAAAWGLAEVMPAGVAFLIVGLVVGVAGTWAFIVGRRRLETFDPMPQETAQTIKEDLEWIRTHRELSREIEETRSHLGTTLDTIGNRVSPGKIVARRTDRLKDRVGSLRDSIMGERGVGGELGAGERPPGGGQGRRGRRRDRRRNRHAPAQIAAGTRGNPLAAGMVAFGIGMIVASLIPATEPEQQAAVALKDKLEPLEDQAKQIGGELKDAVQESPRSAVEDVKDPRDERRAGGQGRGTRRGR